MLLVSHVVDDRCSVAISADSSCRETEFSSVVTLGSHAGSKKYQIIITPVVYLTILLEMRVCNA